MLDIYVFAPFSLKQQRIYIMGYNSRMNITSAYVNTFSPVLYCLLLKHLFNYNILAEIRLIFKWKSYIDKEMLVIYNIVYRARSTKSALTRGVARVILIQKKCITHDGQSLLFHQI